MNFLCENKSDCFCDPNPLSTLNFSSEIPDVNEFLGIEWYFPPPWIGNPGPGTANQPPCVCFTAESQQAADLCAALCSYPRGNPGPPTDNNHPRTNGFPTSPSPLFFNTAQTCQHICADGSSVSYTVPAGSFISYNQDLVNEMAHSLACRRVNNLHLCPTPPTDNCCQNAEYRSTISIPGAATPITFTITSGSLPPGLTDSTSADGSTLLIEGTATTAGTYPFTLMSTTADGTTIISNYTIRVLGITNITSLPDAVENTAYSTQLTGVGGTAPFTYTLVSGSVPGITLSTSGLLSGTPDYVTAGHYPITVKVVNSEGDSCNFDGSIDIILRPGPDWTTLIWTQYQLNQGGAGSSASGAGSQNTAFGDLTWASVLPFPSIQPATANGVTYTGPAVTSRVRLTVSFATADGAGNVLTCRVFRNGDQIGGYGAGFTSGVYEFDFTVAASVGALFDVDGAGDWAEINQIGTNGTLSMTWAIFNL